MLKIYNGTGKDLVIYNYAKYDSLLDKLVISPEESSIVTLVSAMETLGAVIDMSQPDGRIADIIPVLKKSVTYRKPLPEGFDVYVVSDIYAEALMSEHYENLDNIFTVADVIYSQDGERIFGCLGLRRV